MYLLKFQGVLLIDNILERRQKYSLDTKRARNINLSSKDDEEVELQSMTVNRS